MKIRTAIVHELRDAIAQRGAYVDAVEELTPVDGDPIAALPVVAAATLTLIRPALWRLFHSGAVGSYALTPDGWDKIVALCGRRAATRMQPESIAHAQVKLNSANDALIPQFAYF